nr:MAG TPA: hypothetical protein [Caudoviricetes sp.]
MMIIYTNQNSLRLICIRTTTIRNLKTIKK